MALSSSSPADHDGPLIFVDRVGEAQAFADCLHLHRRRMDAEEISWRPLQHVLVFYGVGGVGKTELSLQLASWGSRTATPSSWGPAPTTAVDVAVRWDLNSSHGQVDPFQLLLHLRRGLGRARKVWPAFDLPFAALAQTVRPAQQILLSAPNEGALTTETILNGLLSDAADAVDITVAGGGASAVTGLGRTILSRAAKRSRARSACREFEGLEELIAACERHSGEDDEAVELCARILRMLNLEIDRMETAERPLVAVFVDTFERVQGDAGPAGEGALNQLVGASPYLLFVVTGRNSLRWHEEQQTHLPHRGSSLWPGLVLDGTRSWEPRQHLVGNLSESDTLDYLDRAFASVGATVDPDVCEALFRSTGGWPLHLDTLVEVARGRSTLGRPLTMADLGGTFPQLVNRLVRDLPDDERQAFNAACLLPYFDEQLVAEAGQVSVGTVRRFLQRSIVLPADGLYPHRIHDELRATVRAAGSGVDNGWADSDWRRHARLALEDSFRRFDAALADGDDRRAIHALALGINVATEHDVWDRRLVDGVRRSPTARGLSPLVAAAPPPDSSPDVAAFISYVRALGEPLSHESAEALRAIGESGTEVGEPARVWCAYRLRALGRVDEAVAEFDALIADHTARPQLYVQQRAMTMAMGRRHRDALAAASAFPTEARQPVEFMVRAREGSYDGYPELYERRIETAGSRRFEVELRGAWLRARHLLGRASPADVRRVRAESEAAGHASATLMALEVEAEMQLFDDDVCAAAEREMREVLMLRGGRRSGRGLALFLALRAWATGSEEVLERARFATVGADYRDGGWIPVEILLTELGCDVPSEPVQWVEPEEVVRARWLDVLTGVVDRARTAAPTSPDQ